MTATTILPEKVECREKFFEVNLPNSFTKVTGRYVCDATFDGEKWTALANINGMLCLVEVRVSIATT